MIVGLLMIFAGALTLVMGLRIASQAPAVPTMVFDLATETGTLMIAAGLGLIAAGIALRAVRRAWLGRRQKPAGASAAPR